MISKAMQDAINEQVKHEFESEYLYLSMAAYLHGLGLDGMGQWMRAQAAEEDIHAMKFFGFLIDRDGPVSLKALGQPQAEWASPLAAFQAAYAHEQFITGKINDLVKLAQQENDNASLALLQWFVTEQVEEEATASKVVQSLKLAGDSGAALLLLDREMGVRQAPPAGAGEAPAG